MRHIIPISGKDSLATALVQLKRQPDLPYEYMFNPTGAEFPEVFDWINRVEEYLGKPITQVGDSLKDIIEDNGYFLPSRRARYCTRQAKIIPMEKWLGKDECLIYYGIRYDERTRTGYTNPSGRLTPVMPLIEERIDIQGVYEIINYAGLKPPTFFWQHIYDEVCRIVGGEIIVKTLLKDWQIDILFAWRSRANCSFCFNQRMYEWIGCLTFYPDLFWEAEAMEHKGSDGVYSWAKEPLASIAKRKDQIIKKRIRHVAKIIQNLKQGVIDFGEDEKGFIDTLNVTSCGLFCGK
jgi:hypothetical protein